MCSTSLGHCRCAAVKDSAVILLVRIALLDVLKRKSPLSGGRDMLTWMKAEWEMI